FPSTPPPPPVISTLSLHDALPIYRCDRISEAVDRFTADRKMAPQSLEDVVRGGYLSRQPKDVRAFEDCVTRQEDSPPQSPKRFQDRKSTRLNSSHLGISYAVFCLK